MRIVIGVIAGLGLLVLVVYVGKALSSRHGHIEEPLKVTFRLVDARTGDPLRGGFVATVMYPNQVERLEIDYEIRASLQMRADQPEEAWRAGWVHAARIIGEGETTISCHAVVTRYRTFGIRTGKEAYGPSVLLVDHPELGRSIYPIDPYSVQEGEEPDTWKLDLGTIKVEAR